MNARTHDEYLELAAPYAVGALDRDERAAFEAHVQSCPACAAELRSFDPVVGVLARSVPQVEPEPALRSRVLRAIGLQAVAPADTRFVARPPQRLSWLAAAAAIVLLVGAGGYAVQLRRQVMDLEARLEEAARRADAAERRVDDAQRQASDARFMVAVLTSTDLARVDLAGAGPAPNAQGRAFWSRSRGLVFTASHLPPLQRGTIYQLWVVTPEAPISVGIFAPDASGTGTVATTTPATIAKPIAMAVTLEPEGGVPAPTGEKVLVGTVAGE